MRIVSSRVVLAAASLTLAPALLTACGSGKDDAPAPAPEVTSEVAAAESSAPATTATSAAPTTSSSTRPSVTRPLVTYSPARSSAAAASAADDTSEPSASAASAASATSRHAAGATADVELNPEVEDAYEVFEGFAPRSLFAQFTECTPTGIEDSYNCTGPAVGQVQLVKSRQKATQTTQVLTELRSSRVLSDDGNLIIGWSTLGSTAVLTAVDNDKGLVLQQMISTDQEDPESKLQDMGLLPS